MKTFYLQSTLSLLALFRNLADAKSLRGLSSENMVCRITTVDTMLGEMSDLQSIGSESYDACIPIIDGKETHHLLPIVLEPTLRDQYQELVETGTLLVSIPGATIEGDQLIIPDSSQMKVYDEVPEHLRQLSALSRSPTGTMSVLVVRVTTKDGVSPSASLSTLRQHLFEATPSLKSQYEACSYNKLTFVDGGGLDVKLDQPSSSFSKPGQLLDAAMTKVMQIKGVSDVSSLADKVFFCQPGVVGGWLAVSPVNHWRMNFNDEWCTSLSANIHEMGHNLGLLHSGQGNEDYGDVSGYMGYGSKSSTGPSKCFNAHKNWLLQWYNDRAIQVSSSSPKKVNLATFVDYESTTSQHAVVVNIDNKYFLQYNRAKGMNAGTLEGINKVTIVTPVSSGTRLVAELDTSNKKYSVSNYSNGKSLVVQVCSKNSNSGVDTMVLSIGLGQSYCSDDSVATAKSDGSDSSTSSSSASTSSASGSSSSGSSSGSSGSSSSTSEASTCKSSGDNCTSDSQCCDDAVCLGDSSSTRKCTACLNLFETCTSNSECCGDMKCNNGACRAS